MESSDVRPNELIDLLNLSSRNLPETQRFLTAKLGMNVPRSSYDAIWESLTSRLTKVEAAQLVFEVTLKFAPPRLKRLLQEAEEDGQVSLADDEAGVIEMLFFQNGLPKKLGQHFLEYVQERSSLNRLPARKEGPSQKVPEAIDEQLSATGGLGHRLERVSVSPHALLKVDPALHEKDIEDLIEAHWASIDFGLGERLYLRHRQRTVPNATGRVDLVAQSESGTWYVIELKKQDATEGDYGQLRAYMNNFAREKGLAPEAVFGILLASGFRARLLDAVAHDKNLILLRFLKDEE